jgi:hypothetical protein
MEKACRHFQVALQGECLSAGFAQRLTAPRTSHQDRIRKCSIIVDYDGVDIRANDSVAEAVAIARVLLATGFPNLVVMIQGYLLGR